MRDNAPTAGGFKHGPFSRRAPSHGRCKMDELTQLQQVARIVADKIGDGQDVFSDDEFRYMFDVSIPSLMTLDESCKFRLVEVGLYDRLRTELARSYGIIIKACKTPGFEVVKPAEIADYALGFADNAIRNAISRSRWALKWAAAAENGQQVERADVACRLGSIWSVVDGQKRQWRAMKHAMLLKSAEPAPLPPHKGFTK